MCHEWSLEPFPWTTDYAQTAAGVIRRTALGLRAGQYSRSGTQSTHLFLLLSAQLIKEPRGVPGVKAACQVKIVLLKGDSHDEVSEHSGTGIEAASTP
jgi:hypothetical protein